MKLHQLLAVEKSVRQNADKGVTNAYHNIQKPALFQGMSRTYTPYADDGTRYPDESVQPVFDAEAVLHEGVGALIKQWDLEATKNETNVSADARADVVVDGQVVLSDVPGVTLLYMEKQLEYIKTVISAMPVLDPALEWQRDTTGSGFRSKAVETVKTSKEPRTHVRYPATDKHPAQTEFYWEDVPVGTWTTQKVSTALSSARKAGLLDRLSRLYEAVKIAREKANQADVVKRELGAKITEFLFAV